MDITTIIGVAVGAVLIIFGIVFKAGEGIDIARLGNFFDASSILIVVGGTLSGVISSYPLKILKQIPKHFKIMMSEKKYDPMQFIDTLVEFAQIARKNGLLALEEKANEQTDPFFKQSIMLIVDATDPDKVREMLNNDLDYLSERHEEAVGLYEKASAMAPAFGMIGTLIGLINMLKSLNLEGDGGAGGLGEGMSVALITTFYGCLLAHMLFSPIAKKLSIRNSEEYLCKQIIIEGVLSIQSGENPKFLKEKLISYLSQKQRDMALGDEGGGGEEKGKKKKEKKK